MSMSQCKTASHEMIIKRIHISFTPRFPGLPHITTQLNQWGRCWSESLRRMQWLFIKYSRTGPHACLKPGLPLLTGYDNQCCCDVWATNEASMPRLCEQRQIFTCKWASPLSCNIWLPQLGLSLWQVKRMPDLCACASLETWSDGRRCEIRNGGVKIEFFGVSFTSCLLKSVRLLC